jgi:hypothetical protein
MLTNKQNNGGSTATTEFEIDFIKGISMDSFQKWGSSQIAKYNLPRLDEMRYDLKSSGSKEFNKILGACLNSTYQNTLNKAAESGGNPRDLLSSQIDFMLEINKKGNIKGITNSLDKDRFELLFRPVMEALFEFHLPSNNGKQVQVKAHNKDKVHYFVEVMKNEDDIECIDFTFRAADRHGSISIFTISKYENTATEHVQNQQEAVNTEPQEVAKIDPFIRAKEQRTQDQLIQEFSRKLQLPEKKPEVKQAEVKQPVNPVVQETQVVTEQVPQQHAPLNVPPQVQVQVRQQPSIPTTLPKPSSDQPKYIQQQQPTLNQSEPNLPLKVSSSQLQLPTKAVPVSGYSQNNQPQLGHSSSSQKRELPKIQQQNGQNQSYQVPNNFVNQVQYSGQVIQQVQQFVPPTQVVYQQPVLQQLPQQYIQMPSNQLVYQQPYSPNQVIYLQPSSQIVYQQANPGQVVQKQQSFIQTPTYY